MIKMDYNPMNKMGCKFTKEWDICVVSVFSQEVLMNYKKKYFKNNFTSRKTCQTQL